MNTIPTSLKNNIAKKQITFTTSIKAKHLTLSIIDIQMIIIIKKQFINNSIINNITNKNTTNNTEHILNVKKDVSTKNYISDNCKSQIDYIGDNLYKKQDNRLFNNT